MATPLLPCGIPPLILSKPRVSHEEELNSTASLQHNLKTQKNIYGEIERPFALKDSENISTLHRANCFPRMQVPV
jgi:hypothetical protein